MRQRVREGLAPPLPEAAAAVCANVLSLPAFSNASCVAMFASLPDEVSTRPLFEAARSDGKRCLFPRVIGPGALEFAGLERWEELRSGRYGVPEPPEGTAPAPLSEAEVVLVPGVAFDALGGRLGRGGGYYDRALSRLDRGSSLVIGIALAGQIVSQVPRGPHDETVQVVVTEREVLSGWNGGRNE